MIAREQPYVFDGKSGSALLLAAQIRAGQVFPKQMALWNERHPQLPFKPAPKATSRQRKVTHEPRERVPAIILPPVEKMGTRVLEHVSERTGIPVRIILCTDRLTAYVAARRRVARIMRRIGYSWCAIGRTLHRDHSTIIHYLDPKERRR